MRAFAFSLTFALTCLSASAQSSPDPRPALQLKAANAIASVDAFISSKPCSKISAAGVENRSELYDCLGKARKTTLSSYNSLVLAIRALLRLTEEGSPPVKGRLVFDDAESAWKLYYEKTFNTLETLGGTGVGVRAQDRSLQMIVEHVHQLQVIYADVIH